MSENRTVGSVAFRGSWLFIVGHPCHVAYRLGHILGTALRQIDAGHHHSHEWRPVATQARACIARIKRQYPAQW